MSLLSNYEFTQDEEIIKRIASAVVQAARNIINEDPATANHANRLIWARGVYDANAAMAEAHRVAILMTANGAIASAYENGNEISDNDLLYSMSQEVLPLRVTPA